MTIISNSVCGSFVVRLLAFTVFEAPECWVLWKGLLVLDFVTDAMVSTFPVLPFHASFRFAALGRLYEKRQVQCSK